MTEKRNLKNATKYFKAALAGTLLASIGNAYTFDIINAEESIDSNGDVKVEQLMKVNNVLSNTAYADVKSNYWALDSINWAVSEGILLVDKDGRFRPNDLLTEAEFAHLLVKYYKMNDTYLHGSNLYNKEHWANDAYVTLSKYGVPMLGYNLFNYRDMPVKKGLFAQAISYLNGNTDDIDEAVQHVFELGLKNGNTFNREDVTQQVFLKQNLSRVQATVFLHRMYNKGIVDNKVSVIDDLSEEDLIKEGTSKVEDDILNVDEMNDKGKVVGSKEDKIGNGNKKVDKPNSNSGNNTVKPPKNDSGNTIPSKPKNEVKPNPKPNPKKDPTPKPKDPVLTTKNITETESIGFKTVEQYDNTLEKGKTKVVQNGQKGTKTLTYKITYKDGKQISKELVSSKVTKQPVDKIVKIGTKEPPKNDPKPNPGNPADLVSGVYSNHGMTVGASGSGYAAYGNGHEHIYTGKYINIKFTGNYGTFDIATQALSKLGIHVNVRSGAEHLANSGKHSVSYNGFKFSLDGAYVRVSW